MMHHTGIKSKCLIQSVMYLENCVFICPFALQIYQSCGKKNNNKCFIVNHLMINACSQWLQSLCKDILGL